MKVSVVITTKNRVEYLKRAVSSVYEQSFVPHELIIVDDFSDKRLPEETIKGFKEQASSLGIHFLYFYNEASMGGNFSRNLGVKNSQGEVIHFLDDDDYWLKDKIQRQQKVLQSNKDYGIVYTGKQFVRDLDLKKCFRKSGHSDKEQSIWTGNFIGSTSGVALRRELFDAVGGFDEKLKSLQDYDLWIRVLKHSKAMWDQEFNLLYTVHSSVKGQITGNVDKHIDTVNYLLKKYDGDLAKLPRSKRNIFKSRLQHVIARAYRVNGDKLFLRHMLKSLTLRPSLRTLALIFNIR